MTDELKAWLASGSLLWKSLSREELSSEDIDRAEDGLSAKEPWIRMEASIALIASRREVTVQLVTTIEDLASEPSFITSNLVLGISGFHFEWFERRPKLFALVLQLLSDPERSMNAVTLVSRLAAEQFGPAVTAYNALLASGNVDAIKLAQKCYAIANARVSGNNGPH